MNKTEFIQKLSEKLGYDEEKCSLINDVLENTFLVGKKNKEKMTEEFKSVLSIDEEEANKIYEAAMSLLGSGILDSIKHPFKNKD